MVADVHQLRKEVDQIREVEARLPKPPGPPDNGDMEHRLTALETRFDAILPTLATKSDIGELRAEFKGWTLTTALTLVGTIVAGFIGLATLLMRQAPPPQPQAPIIITLPVPATAAPAPPTAK